jgi:aspartate aminotransferase
MYFTLTYGETKHYHPVALRPEMRDYTITVDGISKSFAATGVRVGWALAPVSVIAKMKALLSHVGAWAPMAEQKAVADFLNDSESVETFLANIRKSLEERLWKIYDGFETLQQKGYNVAAIAPQAAIYLTVKIDLKGKKDNGTVLEKQADVTQYILSKAGLAIVPFHCFGTDKESPWYRISVGTCKLEDINDVFSKLEQALAALS